MLIKLCKHFSSVGKNRFKASVRFILIILTDERVQSLSNKEEENTIVDKAIGTYINEMIKHTMKVYTLGMALSERDPSSAYESIHETLEKVI